jgi:hypothetical protein
MTVRVEPGQFWADNDPRRAGRKLRIDEVKANFVFCTVMQNTYVTQQQIDTYGFGAAQDRRGTTTRIGIARFYDEKYHLCDPTELHAMSATRYGNVLRLPSACTDLSQHRWVPVHITYMTGSRPMFLRAAEPTTFSVIAVCPKCWSHTEFDSKRVSAPTTPGDIAA